MTSSLGLLLLGTGSFVAVALLVPVVRKVAVSYGVTDNPAANKLHAYPTPYLGGVAIAVTAIGASAFIPGWGGDAAVILLGAVLVGTVGLVDDMGPLPPKWRLAAETLAASLAASAGARVDLFGGGLDWVITIIWLVVITNSFNLLDNMDGAAGVIASTTAVCLAVAAGYQGQWLVGGLAALTAGSCLGFLLYNWYPARIFMGDSGSLFLGYLLAVIALKLRFPVDHLASGAAVVLVTGPALFDTTLVVLSRTLAGRPIYLGGTDHTSHRLLRLGLRIPEVALLLASAAGLLGVLGIAVGRGVLELWHVAPPVVGAGAMALAWLLRVPDQDHAQTSVEAAVLVTGNLGTGQ